MKSFDFQTSTKRIDCLTFVYVFFSRSHCEYTFEIIIMSISQAEKGFFLLLLRVNIIIRKSRVSIGHRKENKVTVGRIDVNREKENHLFRFSDTAIGERGELFFFFLFNPIINIEHTFFVVCVFSPLSLLFFSTSCCPIVNYYYSNWTEQKMNLILLFRVLLFLTCSTTWRFFIQCNGHGKTDDFLLINIWNRLSLRIKKIGFSFE